MIHKEDWEAFSGSDPFPHEDIVWGIAYTIDPAYQAEVRDYLDYREKDGYTLETVDVYSMERGCEKVMIRGALCYVGRNDNPSFIGSEPLDVLAERIWVSVGPSGPNKDYLYDLAKSVENLGPESRDLHLAALEIKVRALDNTVDIEMIIS